MHTNVSCVVLHLCRNFHLREFLQDSLAYVEVVECVEDAERSTRVTTTALDDRTFQVIDFPCGDAKLFGHFCYCALGFVAADRPEVCNFFCTVLVPEILENHLSAVILKVDVDVRQIFSGDVDESFEQQVVHNRVNVSYASEVTNQRTSRRSTSRANQHVLFGVTNHVSNHKEIILKFLACNHVQLSLEPSRINWIFQVNAQCRSTILAKLSQSLF